MTSGVRLAVWSGPRNISTALMRSWENRPDCTVVDEPLYAYYLVMTGSDHPGRDEVIAAGETSWQAVVADLTGPVCGVRYQKHMAHHLIPQLPRGWINSLTNVLLIRDPRGGGRLLSAAPGSGGRGGHRARAPERAVRTAWRESSRYRLGRLLT